MGNLFKVVGQCVDIWTLLAIVAVCATIIICKVIFSKRQERLQEFSSKYSSVHMVVVEDDTRIELDLKQ